MIKRGLSANDVDATTGMTMLHYAVRATALSGSFDYFCIVFGIIVQ